MNRNENLLVFLIFVSFSNQTIFAHDLIRLFFILGFCFFFYFFSIEIFLFLIKNSFFFTDNEVNFFCQWILCATLQLSSDFGIFGNQSKYAALIHHWQAVEKRATIHPRFRSYKSPDLTQNSEPLKPLYHTHKTKSYRSTFFLVFFLFLKI